MFGRWVLHDFYVAKIAVEDTFGVARLPAVSTREVGLLCEDEVASDWLEFGLGDAECPGCPECPVGSKAKCDD